MKVPPPDAYPPGTKLTVGAHRVVIQQYISEGGFAVVYSCSIDPPFQGSTTACLKRVVVPSKWQLNLLRQEVDAMKRLRGNPTIVSYIDSHASRHNVAGAVEQQYEVFLLMEYCSKNGLIDFMNTRLAHKLTEPEILVIMRDVTQAVAMCHHLQPPLIHRDIKIENVLIDDSGVYKLCDFGSAVPYAPVPKHSSELSALHDDIMQHTTPQYRAPEMIDLSRRFPIDDKADIWALGCFLYKLCYYTTPFEAPQQASLQDLEQAILHSSQTLKIPHNRAGAVFSPRLKNIIKCCLREDPRRRPNAVQLLDEICQMMNQKAPKVIPASVLERPKRQHQPIQSSNIVEPRTQVEIRKSVQQPDPFASLDKSRLLAQDRAPRPVSMYGGVPSRPQSAFEARNIAPVTSNTASLKDYIQKQLNNSEVTVQRNEDDTLNFLRDREEESQFANQNTGGSFQMIKNGLRKISTGGSSTGIRSNNNTGNYNPNKRSSITSIKQLLTGGSYRKTSGTSKESPVISRSSSDESEKAPKKLSIQKRMQQLLSNDEEKVSKKTASGYGRYTDKSDSDDIAAINDSNIPPSTSLRKSQTEPSQRKYLAPPKVPSALSSNSKNRSDSPQKNVVKKKPPPPKPNKPSYLRTDSDYQARRLSNSSEFSLPDIDDLEKQFAKRFPSYV